MQDNDLSLIDSAFQELAEKFKQVSDEVIELPTDWMEKYFIIPEPRDVVTGEILPLGPIRFMDHQKRVLNEALSKKLDGKFKYSNVIYSAPKKSGKSTTASAVGLYMAVKTPYAHIYVVANDENQSTARLWVPIVTCLNEHRVKKLKLKDSHIIQKPAKATLGNNSTIEAIAVDSKGEAGSEPTAVIFSELWGYDIPAKRKLFTEMTIPPTKWGRSIRWIETYAGYKGESDLLWELYQEATVNGYPHPDFLDLVGRDGEPVVWVNDEASLFAYWDTAHRMPDQMGEAGEAYYRSEARMLSPLEFERLHWNQWVASGGSFINPEWWNDCADTSIPELQKGSKVPMILGVDAAVSGDCAAIVGVTRHPFIPETEAAVRFCKIVKPSPGKPINLERDIGITIRMLREFYNVVCIAYDDYQMESIAQRYKRGEIAVTEEEVTGMTEEEKTAYIDKHKKLAQGWFFKFSQHAPRAVADKRLYDMIIGKQIHWNPNDISSQIAERGSEESLSKHIKHAGAKEDGKTRRIEKLSNDAKIDAAVALSMALDRCMTLNIDNRELVMNDLIKDLQHGKITYEEFNQKLAVIHNQQRTRND
jgi:hypothetical protein